MAYPDLQTMFNNGLGSFASIQAGQQAAEEQQKQAQAAEMQKQLLQEQVLKNQQTQAMNPLDQMFRQGQVNQQQAQLPGLQAQSDMLGSQARVQQGTEASQIAQGLSKASTQIGEDGMKRMKDDATKAIQAAALLDTIPVMQRPAAFQSTMEKYGADPNSSFVKSFTNVPPDQLPTQLRNMGQGMALASEKYIQDKAQQDSVNKTHLEAARIGAGATLGAAKIAADSRMEVARQAASARQQMAANKPKSTDQAIAALSAIPESERSQDEWNQLQLLSKQRIAERSAAINPMAAQMTGQPNAMATAQGQSPVQVPQQQSAPQAPAAPAGMKMVGTSDGKPVYENAQGQLFIGN